MTDHSGNGLSVHGRLRVKRQSASEKLQRLGLDVEFLAWLEGEDERLPDIARVRKVKDAEFAGAIRAVEWLGQHFSDPELISPHTPDAWRTRYELLQQFLYAALGSSLIYHAMSAAEDLETLERVLATLLPLSCWEEYRNDIRQLRKLGLPPRLPKIKAKPAGGPRTSRMLLSADSTGIPGDKGIALYITCVAHETVGADLIRPARPVGIEVDVSVTTCRALPRITA